MHVSGAECSFHFTNAFYVEKQINAKRKLKQRTNLLGQVGEPQMDAVITAA